MFCKFGQSDFLKCEHPSAPILLDAKYYSFLYIG